MTADLISGGVTPANFAIRRNANHGQSKAERCLDQSKQIQVVSS